MKSWSFSANSLPEWNTGVVHLIDQPWYLAAFEWFVWHGLAGFPYTVLRHIPLPNWFPKQRNLPYETDLYTLRDWYGTLGDLWWIFVFDPAFQWMWSKQQKYEITVDIGYPKLKELFGEYDPKFFKRESSIEDKDDGSTSL